MKHKYICVKKNATVPFFLLIITLFIGLMPWTSLLAAECHYASGGPATVSFTDININRQLEKDTPVGTVIFDKSYHSNRTGRIICSGGSISYSEGYSAQPSSFVSSDPCLFNIPLNNGQNSGLGIRIYYDLTKNKTNPGTYCLQYPKRSSIASSYDFSTEGNFRIVLEVVGQLQNGILDLSHFSNGGIWWNNLEAFYLSFTNTVIDIKALSCDVNTPELPVSLSSAMGINADTTFQGMNSTSPEVNFNIELTCDTGTNIAIRFEGNTINGNNSILKLIDQDNSASGVGVQILDKNRNAITFNQPDYILQMSNIQQSQISLPYNARYIQTGSTVTPGKADAEATFYLLFP